MITTKEKLHSYIDKMSEQNLEIVEKLIEDVYWKPVIETDLTEEELAICKAGSEEYDKHPENFTNWEDIKAKKFQGIKQAVET